MYPTYAKIKLKNLIYNYNVIRSKTKRKIMAVVKADAYGHGMLQCVGALEKSKNSPDYYGVALEKEAAELRDSKLTEKPVLCFGPFQKQYIDLYVKKNIIPTLTSESQIYDILKMKIKKGFKVHLNINTGMNRLGIHFDEALKNILKLTKSKKITIDGIYTHFATSDEKNKEFAQLQLLRFSEIITALKKAEIHYGLAHAANSGAILDLPESYFDMVRPGISLYGYYPSLETTESIKLKPVMSLHSKVSTIFPISEGDTVGYGRLFTAEDELFCGSIPAGYADGISRSLSNKMKLIINDKIFDQIGRISMDRINVNLKKSRLRENSKVILLGSSKNHQIDAWSWAQILDTIPYEITCGISKRVPRIYI